MIKQNKTKKNDFQAIVTSEKHGGVGMGWGEEGGGGDISALQNPPEITSDNLTT